MALQNLAQDFAPAHSIFKRCVTCPENVAPTCPVCKSGEICSQTLGDCNTCPSASCVKAITSGSLPVNAGSTDEGPNIGAIVGGCIGGVAFIAIAVFCIWKFWLKGRRHEVEHAEDWEDEYPVEKPNGSVFTRDARSRASTHTVASMASTVLTRASNIIQIAYIPGVTNRGNGNSNAAASLLVPPVPPIPSATPTPSSTTSRFTDDIMFSAGDLRGSTYSDLTDDARRPGSIAPSLARSSVATTVYGDGAVIEPAPVTAVVGGKPVVVSVGSKSSLGSPPPVPSINYDKVGGRAVKPVLVKMPGSDRSRSGSGSRSGTSSLKTMKPVALTIIRKDKKADPASPASALASPASTSASPASALASPASALASPASTSASTRSPTAPSADPKGKTPHRLTAASELSVDSSHRRARQSALTCRTALTEAEAEDELDHERSRRELLAGEGASPFEDAAEAVSSAGNGGTGGEAGKGGKERAKEARQGKAGEGQQSAGRGRGRSPFEDPVEGEEE